MTIQESYSVVASIGNFTFHFFGLISFSMTTLSYLCHKWCAHARMWAVFDVGHIAISYLFVIGHLTVLSSTFETVERICVYNSNLHLCFVSSSIRIGQYEMDFEINLISIKIHTRKAPNDKDRDKTIKYARISISYNNNYDRYKYFIRQ